MTRTIARIFYHITFSLSFFNIAAIWVFMYPLSALLSCLVGSQYSLMTPLKILMAYFQVQAWGITWTVIEDDPLQDSFRYYEYLNTADNILIIMNHQSHLDATIGCLTQCVQRISTCVAFDDFAKAIPLFQLFQPSTFVFIQRPHKNKDGKFDSTETNTQISKFTEQIKKGYIGWICPEGRINRTYKTTHINPLKKGYLHVVEGIKKDFVLNIYRDTGSCIPMDHTNGDVQEGNVVLFPTLIKYNDIKDLDMNQKNEYIQNKMAEIYNQVGEKYGGKFASRKLRPWQKFIPQVISSVTLFILIIIWQLFIMREIQNILAGINWDYEVIYNNMNIIYSYLLKGNDINSIELKKGDI